MRFLEAASLFPMQMLNSPLVTFIVPDIPLSAAAATPGATAAPGMATVLATTPPTP